MKRRHFLKRTLAGVALTTVGASVRGNLLAGALEPKQLLALAGTSAPSTSYYTRMFPGLRGKPSRPRADIEEGLRKLGGAMVDTDPSIEPENQPRLPPAGYTYLGQLIDHDLTLDLTPLENAGDNVERTQNFRTPSLDLDQLYGGGPNLSPFLYRRDSPPGTSPRNAERFLIGKTITAGGREASEDDLPRNSEGIALTADPRQDENLILAQLHVAFLKLHNLIIADSSILNGSPNYRRKGDSDFATAQRVVRWHYQWIVRYDYLKAILDSTVFEGLKKVEEKKRANSQSDFKVPVEFNVAAFRFGHSMVRDAYKGINNNQKDVGLSTIFGLTGPKGLTPPGKPTNLALPAEWRICWNRFFEIGILTSHINRARKIDTQIANGLYHLDEQDVKHFNVPIPMEHLEPKLPVRTLLRGFRMDLPSGEDVAREISRREPGIKILTEDEIVNGVHKEILTDPKYGFRKNTPLWYYVLKEAEVTPRNGRYLGPVGSYIVADVILDALVADHDSYLWSPDYPKWVPTLDDGEANSMGKLLKFVFPTMSADSLCDPRRLGS